MGMSAAELVTECLLSLIYSLRHREGCFNLICRLFQTAGIADNNHSYGSAVSSINWVFVCDCAV